MAVSVEMVWERGWLVEKYWVQEVAEEKLEVDAGGDELDGSEWLIEAVVFSEGAWVPHVSRSV
jgi:hypothetical protein